MISRLFILFVAFISISNLRAQNIKDALRYSSESLNGTARFNAMSGAFGALGADVSSIIINPAGSAIFIKSTGSATISVLNKKNKSNYFETNKEVSNTNLKFNQAGFIFSATNRNNKSAFNKFSGGFSYVATNNFDNEIFIAGIGNNSIADYFLEQADGVPLDLLQLQSSETISSLYTYLGANYGVSTQNAFLGYQSYIIDPINANDPENSEYESNVAAGIFNQNYYYSSTGYNGKYAFNFATEIKNVVSIGINLNSNNFNYRQSTFLNETNNNLGGSISYIGFQNDLYAYGGGFSAQIGAIAKITNSLKIGTTFDTPTWYNIYEETSQYIETTRELDGLSYNEYINPRIVNVFSKYSLTTPWKLAFSGAYIFGKRGLISFDYSYKDYKSTRFSTSSSTYFNDINTNIKNELKGSSAIKIGGEYRFNRLSFRGGYQFEQSPYTSANTIGDLIGFSGGLGIYLESYSIDFSYSRIQQSGNYQLYNVGLTDKATIDKIQNNFVFTINYVIY